MRQVKRTCDVGHPALHRSSYEGNEDPVVNWKESCDILQDCIDATVNDCLRRGVSLVLEGVHIVPCKDIIKKWVDGGGVGLGIVLSIDDEEVHKRLIHGRGYLTGRGAETQLRSYHRIRAIQAEMVRLGQEQNWEIINEKTKDPFAIVTEIIDHDNPTTPGKIHPLSL